MQLETPLGYIILCFTAGILYAGILYFRNKTFTKWVLWSVSFLRFSLVSFLFFLLLSPSTRINSVELETPKLIWLQDNSISAGIRLDTNTWRDEQSKKIIELEKNLGFEIISIPFDESIKAEQVVNFSGETTDISKALKHTQDVFFNQNIAAVVLATDGLYNRGYDPRYISNVQNWPIFSWVMGDTALQIDSRIDNVHHNKIAYRGNQFQVEVTVDANIEYDALKVLLKKGDKILAEKRLKQNSGAQSFSFFLQENKIGLQTYQIELIPLDGEKNLNNNTRLVYINIVENKKKILIVSNQSHPDIAAIRTALSGVEEYKIELKKTKDVLAPLTDIDLLILHQLPGKRTEQKMSNYISSYKGNVLYLTGGNTSYRGIKTYQKFFSFEGRNMEMVKVHRQPVFTKFKISNETASFFEHAPELWSNQGALTFNGAHEDLYRAKIFNVKTNQPVMSFGEMAGRNFGLINGEGIWQWKLYDYKNNHNHTNFNHLFRQIVRFLASRETLSRFRIDAPTHVFSNAQISIDAELYNPSYELTTDGEVTLELIHESDKVYEFTLNTSGNYYQISLNGLPSGKYTFTSTAKLGSEVFSKSGYIFIEPVVAELLNTRANYNLLNTLAKENRGSAIIQGQWKTLEDELSKLETPIISHQNTEVKEWIFLKWIFFLLLTLLSLEWLMRKRNGAY